MDVTDVAEALAYMDRGGCLEEQGACSPTMKDSRRASVQYSDSRIGSRASSSMSDPHSRRHSAAVSGLHVPSDAITSPDDLIEVSVIKPESKEYDYPSIISLPQEPFPRCWSSTLDAYICRLDARDMPIHTIVKCVKQRLRKLDCESAWVTPGMIDKRLLMLDMDYRRLYWTDAIKVMDRDWDVQTHVITYLERCKGNRVATDGANDEASELPSGSAASKKSKRMKRFCLL